MNAQEMFEKMGWHKKQHNGYETDYLWTKEIEYEWGVDYENPLLLLFDKNKKNSWYVSQI